MMILSTLTTKSILLKYIKFEYIFSTNDSIRNYYKFRKGFTANKHWNPKWKKFRALKVVKIDLPDFTKKNYDDNLSAEEMRFYYKEKGIQPVPPWNEKQFSVTTLSGVLDQYIPPEGDGKLSPLNTEGAQQKLEWLKKKTRSWKDLRTIRKYEEDFELYPEFVEKVQEIYIKSQELLTMENKEKLIDYVTEKAYPLMLYNLDKKTIHWKFIKSLEPPRVCHIRVGEVFTKQNLFAQITVRFHTKQILAIYDRFGRLMYGSETIAKDALEYIVFEKHISSVYGEWRLHHKIIPDWLPEIQPGSVTYIDTESETETSPEMKDADVDTIKTVPM